MALSAIYTLDIAATAIPIQKAIPMKTLLFSLLFVSTSFIAGATDDPSISGQWQVHTSVSGNESDMACTITQKGDALAGTCTSDRGKFEISGKVNGKKVEWSYKSEYEGTPLTVKYDGVLDSATKMTGNVDVPEFNASGDFTATQSK
jgi:hypothetical protein